ncbi:MAG: hypothetical protein PVH79_01220 [Candidatus Bathyarchaeota archaeon]|jgi:hypothetical protein
MDEPQFHLRIKFGDVEVELGGKREDVYSTLDDLDEIVEKIGSIFDVEGSLHDESEDGEGTSIIDYPKINRTSKCSDAVVSLLATDWGKTPRTISELREGMEANAIFFPKTTLSGVLVWLVKKGRIRRWKDKKRGYLYVLNVPEDD